ncbi:Metal-dependent carboxypeptidase [Rhodovastum atsumiense]|nr:Metal-dependent carboxypeptidase [Rhodovastum atsumiense]
MTTPWTEDLAPPPETLPTLAAVEPAPAYERLVARFARIATVHEAAGMLNWDAATMMPSGGGAARGDQLAVLAGLAHGLLVAPEVAEDLALAEAAGADSDPWQAANLRLMRHAHTRATALPADLVEAQARANSACEKVWREARRTSHFALVAPALTQVLALVREQAAALSGALGLSPYDALMDGFQPGIGAADVAPVFAAYEAFLRDALPRAEALQAARPAPLRLPGPFPAAEQEALCRRLLLRVGLDADHARLDRSTHPFCGGIPTDVRITTRYDEAEVAQAVMGVLHEGGHGLYERGLPAEWARQPVGQAAGMGMHESQSLIMEMQACRSDPFLSWLGTELHASFGGDPEPYRGDNLARLWRRVKRGFIRVDADEMTYPAHVILRFRLEQALVAGDLAVADLPGAWAEGMQALLGITPPDDAQGCLQDIHWYDGAFGYFPSYTLGAMAAAQLMAAARREVAGLDAALGRGDVAPLQGWLRSRVHAMGSRMGFNDLLRHATGKPLDPQDFEAHLTARYLRG